MLSPHPSLINKGGDKILPSEVEAALSDYPHAPGGVVAFPVAQDVMGQVRGSHHTLAGLVPRC